MSFTAKPLLHRVPYVRDLLAQFSDMQKTLAPWQRGWPRGHFYSPIPSLDDVRRREDQIFRQPSHVPGVDLNEEGQLRLAESLIRHYPEQPFTPEKCEARRYFFENPNFTYGEAIVLYGIMRHLRPRRVIEVGSGYSSCVTLDTDELFLGSSVACTFIEPYPELLYSLLKAGDRERITVLPKALQEIAPEFFSVLEAGDILFIDSTHVSKIDSDVNHLFFEVLPSLRSGVYVHLHDIYYPFEYPKKWLYEGRAWNEAYLLRAFLQFNQAFRIAFYNAWFGTFQTARAEEMPLFRLSPGSSIWLERL